MSATADEVLEAMARGIHDANPGVHEPWANIVAAETLGNRLAQRTAALRRAEARAAIRALPAGWVVAKVPEEVKNLFGSERAQGHAEGWNTALAAVRASAVAVE